MKGNVKQFYNDLETEVVYDKLLTEEAFEIEDINTLEYILFGGDVRGDNFTNIDHLLRNETKINPEGKVIGSRRVSQSKMIKSLRSIVIKFYLGYYTKFAEERAILDPNFKDIPIFNRRELL